MEVRIAETDPLDADIHYYIEQAESAKNKECSLTFLPNDTIDDGYFEMMLFAASKEEDVAQAIKKRDEIVASGEWEKAYMKLRQ